MIISFGSKESECLVLVLYVIERILPFKAKIGLNAFKSSYIHIRTSRFYPMDSHSPSHSLAVTATAPCYRSRHIGNQYTAL
jgi:hypothetical protein